MMRAFSLHLIVAACLVSWSPGWCFGQSYLSYAEGKRFKVDIVPEDVDRAPKWKEDEENPPLSARRAVKLANAVKERLVTEDGEHHWEVDSVQLVPLQAKKDTDRWVWMVVYRRVRVGFQTGPAVLLRLAVLMDGTVPEPTVTKTQSP